jgi:hypothetical protein
MPPYSLIDPAIAAFIVIPVALVLVFSLGVGRAWRRTGQSDAAAARAVIASLAGEVSWMALTAAAAQSGVLRQWNRNPPPFVILMVGVLVVAGVIAFSPLGRRLAEGLPLWGLVAFQGFRLPLELAMHGMYERGIMPAQMSYSGRNFDIVTGITAIAVAGLLVAGRGGRALVAAWNILGLLLLTNIVVVALLSTPRFAFFGQDRLNVWITYPPFVWLPAVMVASALAGHLVIFRAVRRPADITT